MKLSIALAALLVSSMAFAQGAGTAGTAGTEVKKMSKKEAKAACKSEGKKGKELATCVKEKMAM